MADIVVAIAALLKRSGQAHHQAFLTTDGDDPEWPSWYAEYLLDDLNALLGSQFSRDQLANLLIELDRSHKRNAFDTEWPKFYAEFLVSRFGLAACEINAHRLR